MMNGWCLNRRLRPFAGLKRQPAPAEPRRVSLRLGQVRGDDGWRDDCPTTFLCLRRLSGQADSDGRLRGIVFADVQRAHLACGDAGG
jgi:hypothetical protein